MVRLSRLSRVIGLPGLSRHHLGPIAVLAGMALAVSLSGCDGGPKASDQVAAQTDLNAAGRNLEAAAADTGQAIKLAAADAKPEVKKLGAEAKQGLASLSDEAGDAAAKAGAAVDKAGRKTDAAAHDAADKARQSTAGQ